MREGAVEEERVLPLSVEETPVALEIDDADDPELLANREAAEAVDLESLTAKTDMSVFLKKGVPKALKTAAFRKLWTSDPVFAVLDGLNDYDEDFRAVDTVTTEFRTAWEVGRGYQKKAEEMAAEAERLAQEASAASAPANEAVTSLRDEESLADDGDIGERIENRQHQEELNSSTPKVVTQTDVAAADMLDEEPRKVPIRRRMSVSFDEG